MLDQSFQVLPHRDHHSFDVHLLQTYQTETPQAVKVFGFSKERLNPHASFSRCFFICLGLMIRFQFVYIFLMERTKYMPPTFAARTLIFDRTSITNFCVCSINLILFTLAPRPYRQDLFLRTDILVILSIIMKQICRIIFRSFAQIRHR